MSSWSDFQSLFQLSVGVNTAFAVLYDFVGNAPKKEAAEAHDLAETAFQVAAADLATELFTLEGKFRNLEVGYENWLLNYIRPSCLLMAISSLIFLAVSSFFYNGRIVIGFQVYALVEYLPFLLGVAVVIYVSGYRMLQLTRQKTALKRRLAPVEANYYKSKPTEREKQNGGSPAATF